MLKRLFDIVLSAVLLILFSLIMTVVALLTRLFLGKPVLFRQMRPGINGKPFYLFKFRTMSDKKDAQGNLLPDAMRTTILGNMLRKYSLDELPQLVNVLKGDMSFVGPRPLLMEYLSLYSLKQARRHEVKPGITGWAQVNGRNAISWQEKFRLDIWYVENQSFLLDIKILFLTIKKVFNSEGINQNGHVTMEKFKGEQ